MNCPPAGGETEFADLRAAYDALDAATQERIEDLVAEHSMFHSRSLCGYTDFTEEEAPGVSARSAEPGPCPSKLRPKDTLPCLPRITHHRMASGAGRALLGSLTELSTQPQFVYRHHWRLNDLVVWDNRCTLHRARPYDDAGHRRDMRRTTVEDTAPTSDQDRAWSSSSHQQSCVA